MGFSTPPSTAQSDNESPTEPPTKRRRITKHRDVDATKEDEKMPQYLDLSEHNIDPDEQEQMDKLLKVLNKRRKIGKSNYRSVSRTWC
jgi:NAD-dependent histone deacetylase SIR2